MARQQRASETANSDAIIGEAMQAANAAALRTLTQTAGIVSSYVSRNMVPYSDLPGIITSVHSTILGLGAKSSSGDGSSKSPAVPVKKSVTDEYIICLEDGRKLTMLKRYLKNQYNLTPEEYRKKWDLPHDYPMIAPAYSRLRSAFAKKIGLGKVPTPRTKKSK